MSTRSRIGIEETDGFVRSVYCHNDGYVEHVGKMLHQHYDTETKVRELIKLGDLSSVGPELRSGSTTAYERDRNETDVGASADKNARAFLTRAFVEGDAEFAYLFRTDAWWFKAKHGDPLALLTPAVVATALAG